ncbi:MAG: BON domain-containing protein [Luteolibacter sp.]
MKTRTFSSTGIRSAMVAITFLSGSHFVIATPEATPTAPEEVARVIEMDVRADMEMRDTEIRVTLRNGIAVLEGKVATLNQSERAMERALATIGVRAVANLVEIQPAREPLKSEVRSSLRSQVLLDASNITISENQGRVVLAGTVGTWDEQELARELVSRVAGVWAIDNRLEVTYEGIRTDAQIQAQLKEMIADDPLYAGLDLTATVKEGVVSLNGKVGSKAEMDRLIRRSYVTGVFEVQTGKLSIDPDLAMEILTDKELTPEQTLATYQEVLELDPRVDAASIKASLHEGVMTLRGHVRDMREKDAAEANARGVPGVDKVSNELRVRANREVAKR